MLQKGVVNTQENGGGTTWCVWRGMYAVIPALELRQEDGRKAQGQSELRQEDGQPGIRNETLFYEQNKVLRRAT